MKMLEFRLKFNLSMLLRVWLTIDLIGAKPLSEPMIIYFTNVYAGPVHMGGTDFVIMVPAQAQVHKRDELPADTVLIHVPLSDLNEIIFKLILVIHGWCISYEI